MTTQCEHYYGDFAELVTLFSAGEYFTASDLLNRFRDHKVSVVQLRTKQALLAEADISEVLTRGEPDDEDEDEGEAADDLAEGAADLVQDEIGSKHAETLDREEAWAHSVFGILQDRFDLYGDDYPYEVGDKKIRIRAELTPRQHIYLALLLASNLKYFALLEATLTTDFEEIAFQVLRNFLPGHAVVRQFGKKSNYKGTAQKKIKALAGDLNVKINEDAIAKIEGTQERGVDVVGWIPFQDKYGNVLTILGQCACGKEWPAKYHETRRFDSSYYTFEKLRPIHAMFVPMGLNRRTDFFQSDEIIESTLMFERRRMLQFIVDTTFFAGLRSSHIVEMCSKCVEDLV